MQEPTAIPPAPALPHGLQFMRLLWALAHGLDRRSKLMATRIGVTGPQRFVLRVVGLMPGVSAGDLADFLHVHPSTLTGILQRLVAQRLLVRTRDAADKRRAVLHLTPKGAQINAAIAGTVEAAVVLALDDMTPHDRAACQRVLERVTGQLDPDVRTAAKGHRT